MLVDTVNLPVLVDGFVVEPEPLDSFLLPLVLPDEVVPQAAALPVLIKYFS